MRVGMGKYFRKQVEKLAMVEKGEKDLRNSFESSFDVEIKQEFFYSGVSCHVTFSVYSICLPQKLLGLENAWNRSTVALRFSFFDKEPVFTQPFKVTVG